MEEKKKLHKKPRMVTEELNPVDVSMIPEQAQEATEPMPEQATNDVSTVEDKPLFAVAPTDNIDHNLKSSEKGVFLKFFVVTFFATLLAFLLAGGIYVYLTGTKTLSLKDITNSSTPTPIPTDTPIPSASPSANIDVSTFKVSVLNGNGGIGVAGAAKTIIEKAGFKVGNLGNADNFAFTDTLIQVKPNVSADVVSVLKKALDANYSVKIGDQLDSASTYDIVVTVGSK